MERKHLIRRARLAARHRQIRSQSMAFHAPRLVKYPGASSVGLLPSGHLLATLADCPTIMLLLNTKAREVPSPLKGDVCL